jgi:hypothetical protein
MGSTPLAMASATGSLPSASAPTSFGCSREIQLVDLEPETPTCTVYGLDVGARGVLEGPCHGNGPALARFGTDTTFTGTLQNGTYALQHRFTRPIGDGCEWRFSETITGTGKHLVLEYSEEITRSGPNCYRPCGAQGEIEVR